MVVLFVAGVVFGDVGLSHFVAGAVFGGTRLLLDRQAGDSTSARQA